MKELSVKDAALVASLGYSPSAGRLGPMVRAGEAMAKLGIHSNRAFQILERLRQSSDRMANQPLDKQKWKGQYRGHFWGVSYFELARVRFIDPDVRFPNWRPPGQKDHGFQYIFTDDLQIYIEGRLRDIPDWFPPRFSRFVIEAHRGYNGGPVVMAPRVNG